jgi:amino acid transporter
MAYQSSQQPSILTYLRNFFTNQVAGLPNTDDRSTAWVESVPLKGILSLSIVAPVLLALLTAVLVRGAAESAVLNRLLTGTKLATIAVVIAAGSTQAETRLWSPAFPNGAGPIASQVVIISAGCTCACG